MTTTVPAAPVEVNWLVIVAGLEVVDELLEDEEEDELEEEVVCDVVDEELDEEVEVEVELEVDVELLVVLVEVEELVEVEVVDLGTERMEDKPDNKLSFVSPLPLF